MDSEVESETASDTAMMVFTTLSNPSKTDPRGLQINNNQQQLPEIEEEEETNNNEQERKDYRRSPDNNSDASSERSSASSRRSNRSKIDGSERGERSDLDNASDISEQRETINNIENPIQEIGIRGI